MIIQFTFWVLLSGYYLIVRLLLDNRTLILPQDIAIIPLNLVLLLYITVGNILGYYELLPLVYVVLFVGYSAVFLPNLILKYDNHNSYIKKNDSGIKDTLIAGIFVLITLIGQLRLLFENGHLNLKQLNNEDLNSSGSLLIFFLLLFVSKLIGKRIKSKWDYIVIVLISLSLFLTFVKGTFLIGITAGLINLVVFKETKISYKKLALFALFGFVVFVGSYLVRVYTLGVSISDGLYEYSQKFFAYFFAGIGSFNANLIEGNQMTLEANFLISPLVNFCHNIFGIIEPIRIIDEVANNSIQIGTNMYSNVNTFWGTIYFSTYKMYSFMFIFLFFLFLITNIFITIGHRLGYYTQSGVSIWLSGLFFSWFEYYYWHSFFFYVLIFGVLLDLISKVKWSVLS